MRSCQNVVPDVRQFPPHQTKAVLTVMRRRGKLVHRRTDAGEEQVPLRDINLHILTSLFEGGVYDCQVVKSLHGPLVDVVHLRVGLCVFLIRLAEAALLAAQ